MQTMQTVGDTTMLLGKGVLTTTIATTKDAGNMFVDAAHKTNKSISSLVHDAAALALHGEEPGGEENEEPPAPLFVPSSWEPKENIFLVSQSERDNMAQRVDEVIKTALRESETRAVGLKEHLPSKDPASTAINGLHLTYTRALASLRFPTHRGTPEQTEMWTKDGGSLLREWCSKAAQGQRVTDALHAAGDDFLESYTGKGSLMAGLNARHQIINRHPFYHQAAFGSAEAYESWKLRELEMIENQKKVLVTFTKREVVVEVLELRGRELPQEAEERAAEEIAPKREEAGAGGSMGMGKMMGGFSSMLRKSTNLTKDMTSALVHNPVSSVAKATAAVVTAPITITEVMTRTRGEVWCVVTFADHVHATEKVPDVTAAEPSVRFDSSVTWQVHPSGKGAVCVQVWRRRKHAVEMPGIRDEDELLGTTMHSWEEIMHTAELHTPIEGWFTIEDGSYDEHGRSEGTRELMVRVQLLSKPIDGSEEYPLFDPSMDLHKVYSDFYRALNPGLSMMPPPACEWILREMRIKCGVGESWHHLLRLAPGLDLRTPEGLSKGQEGEVREGRLVALLECIKGGRAMAVGTLSLIEEGLRLALRFLQAQVRNELYAFPYRLAAGAEEEHFEPVELQLLMEVDEAIVEELGKMEDVGAAIGLQSTEQVVEAGLMAFVHGYYGECIAEVLEKKKCEDGSVPEGHVQPVHVKKLSKRTLKVLLGLHDNFSRVLPAGAELRAMEHLVDMLTVDVLALVAGYHVRGMGPRAFEEGSEEARLLQLHLKTVELRKTLVEVLPGITLGGLATATAPVLAAWVESTDGVLAKWMESAVKLDTWEPAGGGEGGWSSSLVDVFSSAEGAVRTFAQMRMGAVPSVRKAFLEMIGDVCKRYLKALEEAAEVEQRERQEEAERRAAASKKGAMGAMLGLMSFQNLGDLNFMSGVNWKERAEKAKKSQSEDGRASQDRGASQEGRGSQDEGQSWVETAVEKSEGYLEKMEQLADDVTSVKAWKKGFMTLGSKSLALTKNVTKKTVKVTTFGMMGGEKGENGESDAASGASTSVTRDKAGSLKPLTSRDFFDGVALVTPKACTRMCDAVQVKLQLNNMILLLEEDEGWTGGEGMAAVQGEAMEDWTLSPQMLGIYDGVRAGTDEVVDMELRPLLQWLAQTIGAALTDQGGTVPDAAQDIKAVFEELRWQPRAGEAVVRGPHWNCGSQDGSYDGSKVEGVVTDVLDGWVKVRWSDHAYSYRVGADGCYDVQPASLKLPDTGLPPAVAAIEEALDATLQVLRERLTDTGFNLCLKVVWIACVSVLETCLRDDMTGNIVMVKRAKDLLERLQVYMHADGNGLKEALMEESALALTKTMEASLL